MQNLPKFLALSLLVALAACGPVEDQGTPDASTPVDADEDGRDDAFLTDGVVTGTQLGEHSREAKGVRRLLAEAGEDLLKSKTDVGLGPKAAAELGKLHAGPDGLAGTADDAPPATLQALDDVPYVGPKAWAKLLAYARAHGFVPPDPCGEGEPVESKLPLPSDVRRAAPDLALRVGTDRLQVYVRTSSTLTDEDVEKFRARSCAALTFNLDLLDLDSSAPELAEPIRVVVLDVRAYGKATGAAGTYGVTFPAYDGDGDAFVMPDDALEAPMDLDDTLAHELTHIIQDRYAPENGNIPWYLIEGQAIDVGSLFAFSIYGESKGFVNGWIEKATGADARLTFERYDLEDNTTNLSQVGHDQAISGLFVEYLRVLHPRGETQKGWPDAPRRVLDVMREVSGGKRLAPTFEKHFEELPLAEAHTAYATWLDESKPLGHARFDGTVWE